MTDAMIQNWLISKYRVMTVNINGDTTELPDGSGLTDILGIRNIDPAHKGVAVAVNNRVVPRDKWDSFIIRENDNILIIKATQGG